ncbi:protein-L-isoaspartate(D-aspartate) O-methyltransferase [Patescibacteria group bacterium]
MNNIHPTKSQLLDFWKETFNFSERILAAFKKVPREDFVGEGEKDLAYADVPLPTAEGQTISQPSTVMMMLDLLEIQPDDRILEIGCGSGYNAALMSVIAKKGQVTTCDIFESLTEKATSNLRDYKNIEVISDDGFKVAKEKGPFDKVVLTAAIKEIPDVLIDNLNDNGIILAPVGDIFIQIMIRLRKSGGKIKKDEHGEFMFVPIQGEYGF